MLLPKMHLATDIELRGCRRFAKASNWVTIIAAVTIAFSIVGCSGGKWAGDWHGIRVLAPGKKMPKSPGYGDSKPSMESSLYLNGDGSYTAKFSEINYTGDWKDEGQKITLTPKTYMGMDRSSFPKTKTETSSGTIDNLFRTFSLDESTDGKTLTHTDDLGTVTFHKKSEG